NDVVVAIIDGGFDIDHEDLKENIWRNEGEIPDNGIDDDGNGYVDDIVGWNAQLGNGKVALDDHGTLVAGVIGARGNNATGVTGINWNTKMMLVSIQSADTATVVAAYGYVLKQKELWLKTN